MPAKDLYSSNSQPRNELGNAVILCGSPESLPKDRSDRGVFVLGLDYICENRGFCISRMLLDITDRQGLQSAGDDLGAGSNSLLHDPNLSRIRSQINSADPLAVREAVFLQALESTISDFGRNLPPVAYFGLLLTLVERNLTQDSSDSRDQLLIQLKFFCTILRKQKTQILLSRVDILSDLLVRILTKYYNDLCVIRMVTKCGRRILEREELCRWSDKSQRAILCRNMLLLAASRDLEEVSSHLRSFFTNALSDPVLNHPIRSSFKRDIFSWCDSNLCMLEKKLDGPSFPLPGFDLLGLLDYIIEICIPISVSEGYGSNEKRVGLIIKVLEKSYSAFKDSPDRVYELISSTRKLISALDCRDYLGRCPAWCVYSTKSLAIIVRRVMENAGNPNVLSNAINVLSQAIRGLHSASKLSECTAMVNVSDSKLLNSTDSWYDDELLSIFDDMLRSAYLVGSKCSSDDYLGKIMQSIHSLAGDCISPLVGDHGSSKLHQLLCIVKNYMQGYIYRPIWGSILGMLPILIQNVRPLANVILTLIHEVPQFKLFLLPTSDDLGAIKMEIDSCMVFFAGSLGFKDFVEAIVPSESSSAAVAPKARVSLYPQLVKIYSRALNEWNKNKSLHEKITLSTHSLGQLIDVILPEIDILTGRISNKSSNFSAEEIAELDGIRLDMWGLISKLCGTLSIDTHESFVKFCAAVDGVLSGDRKGFFFSNSKYCDEYIKEAHRAYSMLLMSYNQALEHAVAEDQVILRSKYEAVEKSTEKYIPILCNRYLDVSKVNCIRFDTLPRSVIAQEISKGENGLLRECVYWTAVTVDKTRILDYLSLLIKAMNSRHKDAKNQISNIADSKNIKMYLMLGLVEILVSALRLSDSRTKKDVRYGHVLATVRDTVLDMLPTCNAIEQKKSYSVLRIIVDECKGSGVMGMLGVLTQVPLLNSVAKGSRKNRILVLSKLITSIPQSDEGILFEACSRSIPEIVLSTKDKGVKVGKAAYIQLLAIAHHMCYIDTLDDGNMQDILVTTGRFEKFMYILFAGLALDDRMKAATAISSIYIISKFSNIISDTFLEDVFSTVSEFRKSDSLVLLKAYLVSIRLLVSSIPQDRLDSFLENIIQGLLDVAHKEKHKLRNITLNIFDKIARKFSYEALEGFIPPSDSKLLTSIRKRAKRRSQDGNDNQYSEDITNVSRILTIKNSEMTNRTFKTERRSLRSGRNRKLTVRSRPSAKSRIPSDSESLDSLTTFGAAGGARSNRGITINEVGGECTNLLDVGAAGSFSVYDMHRNSHKNNKKATDYFEEDACGRMIITDDVKIHGKGKPGPNDMIVNSSDTESDFMDDVQPSVSTPSKNIRSLASDVKSRLKAESRNDMSVGYTGRSWGYHHKKSTLQKMLRKKKEISNMTGKRYRNKRAKGDVRKDVSKEPYAYIALKPGVVSSISKILKKKKR